MTEPVIDARAGGAGVSPASAGGAGVSPASKEGAAGSPEERVRALTGFAPSHLFDHDRICQGVRMLLEAVGIDPTERRVAGTPERVARMFDEIFAGLLVDPVEVLDVLFEEDHDEIVLVRDIPFASVCEHHLVPFVGRAHVGYLPNTAGQVTGISKLARLVDIVAKQPNLQERITTTVADTLEKVLSPRGVIVIIEAEHFCMTMRGVRKPGAITVTSAVRGLMRDDPRTRAEVMGLIYGHRGSGWG